MKEHYQINDIEYTKLSQTVSIERQFKSIPLFEEAGGKLGLMYYIDKFGDFNEGNELHKRIARAIFNSLDIKDKLEIDTYLSWEIEDGQIA